MAGDNQTSDDDFDQRSREIRQHVIKRGGISLTRYEAPPQTYSGWAYRVGMELVVSVAASVFVGIMIDDYFDTAPWGLIGMFLVGGTAAMRNIFKLIERYSPSSDDQAPTSTTTTSLGSGAEPPAVDRTGSSRVRSPPRPMAILPDTLGAGAGEGGGLLKPRDHFIKKRDPAASTEPDERDQDKGDQDRDERGYIDRL